MSKRKALAPLSRRLRARREPGPLIVTWKCPRCGGPHARAHCDVDRLEPKPPDPTPTDAGRGWLSKDGHDADPAMP